MKRRDFLRQMAVLPTLARSSVFGGTMLANIKNSYAANGKTLIVIFQRGGCDGLNVTIPYGEDEYYNLRPDISIPAPNSNSLSALDLNGFFGLHPSLTGLHDIYQNGNLAVLPTVHYSDANRSHFSSQDFIESGVPNQRLADGWLNRYLAVTKNINQLPALNFGSLAHSLQGISPVLTINNLSSISDSSSELQRTTIQNIFNQSLSSSNQARDLVYQHGNSALQNTSTFGDFATSNYPVDNGANYPDSSYGQQLKNIAQLIKARVGIEIATVSTTDWDHHANQGGVEGKQATKLMDFSEGIKALYTDLGSALMNDVTILTISEFGRTAKQNASLGTDHGNASTWFVIGGQVNGGIYGDWPGLLPDQLYKARYLAHTINFTDVYAEVLSKHLEVGDDLSTVLPSSSYSPIGFL